MRWQSTCLINGRNNTKKNTWTPACITILSTCFAVTLKKNAEILEITCGLGNIIRYLLDRRPDFIP